MGWVIANFAFQHCAELGRERYCFPIPPLLLSLPSAHAQKMFITGDSKNLGCPEGFPLWQAGGATR